MKTLTHDQLAPLDNTQNPSQICVAAASVCPGWSWSYAAPSYLKVACCMPYSSKATALLLAWLRFAA